MTVDRAFDDIDAADIKANDYRAAVRLLRAANQDTGMAWLTVEQAMDLCMAGSDGAMRRVLGHLQAAGVIHYTTNGTVYVMFKAWSPDSESDHPRAKSDHPRALFENDELTENEPISKSDHPRAKSDHPRAKSDHPRAKSENVRRSRLDRQKDLSIDPDQVCLSRAPEPETAETRPPKPTQPQSKAEYDRSLALLTDPDVGVFPETAAIWAANRRFDWLMAQVMTYRRELAAGKVNGSGALVGRMDKDYRATIVPSDRETELYKRHATPEDGEAERRRRYIPDEYQDIIIH